MTEKTRSIQLQSVRVQGYKSCRNTLFTLNPNVSALIGINGVGKTNLLNGIRLLALQARRFSHMDEEDEANINETKITTWFLVNGKKIGYRTRLLLSTSTKNSDEIRASSEEWNLHSITGSRAWKSLPMAYLSSMNRRRAYSREKDLEIYEYQAYLSRLNRQSNFSKLGYFSDEIATDKTIQEYALGVFDYCRGIKYYSASQFTDPARCPSSFEIDSYGRLSEPPLLNRTHLSFLYELYSLKSSNPDLYKQYEIFVSKAGLGLIGKLTWKTVLLSSSVAEVKTGGNFKKVREYKTLVIPTIQMGLSRITFNQLSEGTFKSLALIFYIMTDASSCLLIEEPEVCVHHGLLTKIIATVKSYSSTKQVVLSTHSDLVIDQLEPQNVSVVTMEKTGTMVKTMEDWVGENGRAALNEYLSESGTLGEYWRSGGLS